MINLEPKGARSLLIANFWAKVMLVAYTLVAVVNIPRSRSPQIMIWTLGMGYIDILVYDYCEAKISCLIIMIIALPIFVLKTVYTGKCVKLQMSTNVSRHCKTCHDKCQPSRYYTIIACHNYILLLAKMDNIDY